LRLCASPYKSATCGFTRLGWLCFARPVPSIGRAVPAVRPMGLLALFRPAGRRLSVPPPRARPKETQDVASLRQERSPASWLGFVLNAGSCRTKHSTIFLLKWWEFAPAAGGNTGLPAPRPSRAVAHIQLCEYRTGISICCQVKSTACWDLCVTTRGVSYRHPRPSFALPLSPRAKSRSLDAVERGAACGIRCPDSATLRST